MTKEEIKGVMARTFKSHSVNIGGKVKKEWQRQKNTQN
jgi:hypothetical protein